MARENGVLLSDLTTPCGSSSTPTPGLPPGPGAVKDLGQCVVYVLGIQINTASFAMYTFSLSVLFQALLVVSISCAADHGNYRKRLLLVFAFAGSVATMAFLPIVPKVYLLAALLAMISNTCFGASFVLLNSFLPLLVRHHPKTQYITPDFTPELPSTILEQQVPENFLSESEGETLADSTAALLASTSHTTDPPLANQKITSLELQLSTHISSTGIGIGYSAGLFLQCVCIIVVFAMGSTTFSLRVVLFLIGAWWCIFTIPAACKC